jgi:hypothetical protein
MRSRVIILLAVVALLAAACGSSDGGTTSAGEAPEVTDPPATDPPATDPPATDPPATDPPATDPPATDPPATDPPTTEPPAPEPDPLLELARSVEGTWSGSWTNTTFGSTGAIAGDMTVDEDAMELVVNTDVGGNVFGAADPDPELLVLPIRAGEHTGSSATFGDWTLTIDESGSFSMTAINLPALPGATFTMEGALSDTGIDATYVVDFGSGDPAVGVVTITKS